MILVVDNRDSFTYNLVEALRVLGAEVRVERALALDVAAVRRLAPRGLLIGPGPGTPERAGCSEALVRELGAELPILGVCLGHQALATAFGARLRRSRDLLHGELREIVHDGRGLFEGLPSPARLVRYHSLVVDESSLPAGLEVSARDPLGEIAGLRLAGTPTEGVQYHPEAILSRTGGGPELLAAFVRRCGRPPLPLPLASSP